MGTKSTETFHPVAPKVVKGEFVTLLVQESLTRTLCLEILLPNLKEFPVHQVVRHADVRWPPDESGYLDLYSGVRGAPRAMVRKGAIWVLYFDLKDGADQDPFCRELRTKLQSLVCSGAFLQFGAGPDCSSFSVAVTPPVRSAKEPYSKVTASQNMQVKMAVGNDHAL